LYWGFFHIKLQDIITLSPTATKSSQTQNIPIQKQQKTKNYFFLKKAKIIFKKQKNKKTNNYYKNTK